MIQMFKHKIKTIEVTRKIKYRVKDFSKMPGAKWGYDKVNGLTKGNARIKVTESISERAIDVRILSICYRSGTQYITVESLDGKFDGKLHMYCNGSEGRFKILHD